MTGNMTGEVEMQRRESASLSFTAKLYEAGVVQLSYTITGEATLQVGIRDRNALSDLLQASGLFRSAMRDVIRTWNDQAEPRTTQAMPGLWVCGIPIINRRNRIGYEVAAIPTEDFASSEQFAAMCQAAAPGGADIELCRRRVNCSSTANVDRLVEMIRLAHDQQNTIGDLTKQQTTLTLQLAESYEEMNLLYTITQNMTMRDPPDQFIARSCNELLSTLPYAWIGLLLAEKPQKLKSVSGRFIVAGHSDQPTSLLRSKARLLFNCIDGQSPLVLEPLTNPEQLAYRPLGKTALVQPVIMAGEIVGLLLAGDKRGPDSAASNIDIKLLGAAATHMAIFLENAALYDDLNAMFLGTLEALTASIDAKDRYTCGHSRRVAHLTQLLAQSVGIDAHTVSRCHIAGLVHDVGKIGVPEAVLLKPGKLTDDEFAWIRKHPEIGYRILKDIPQLSDVLPGVLSHHERWDGRGYPHRLAGEAIPLMARLIGLADSFDAMSSTRTYRSALSRPQVLEEIRKCAGAQFDAALAEKFVKLDFTEYDRLAFEHQSGEMNPALSQQRAA